MQGFVSPLASSLIQLNKIIIYREKDSALPDMPIGIVEKNERPYVERGSIIPIEMVRNRWESSVFLTVKAAEAAELRQFDPNS